MPTRGAARARVVTARVARACGCGREGGEGLTSAIGASTRGRRERARGGEFEANARRWRASEGRCDATGRRRARRPRPRASTRAGRVRVIG